MPSGLARGQVIQWIDAEFEQQALLDSVQWCLDPTEALSAQAVADGACPLQSARGKDLLQGLKPGAMWLRFSLGNRDEQAQQLWLAVGQPQLQQFSLWHQAIHPAGHLAWQALHTGSAVPLTQRPIAATYAVLPLTLAPNAVQTFYVRVVSRTTLDATATLWRPAAYTLQQGRLDALHAVALGGLFLAGLFGLLLAGLMRDRSYLFFGLGMLGELVLEGVRSGLLVLYVWPADQPFWVGTLALGSALGTVGLSLFLLEFLGPSTRLAWLVQGFKVMVAVYLLCVGWAVVGDYRQGAIYWIWVLQGVLLLGLALIVQRLLERQRHVGYLLLAFLPVIVLEVLRFLMAHGWFMLDANHTMAGPWGLIFVTPLLLLALARRSRDTYAALIRAQALSQSRANFLAQMSHELRAPLATVQGYADILISQKSRISTQEAAHAILRASKRLLNMVDEALNFARGEVGRTPLELSRVQWDGLMQDLLMHGQALSQTHGSPFELLQSNSLVAPHNQPDPLPDLMLDERRLRQVVDNLLTNAFRHGGSGPVRLICQSQRLPDQKLDLSFVVSDSGPGIAPEAQTHIFDPFVRGNSAQPHGLGLGLAVARQMAELMGGTLVLHSQLGHGCTFTFRLRCALSEDIASQKKLPPQPNTNVPEMLLNELQSLVALGAVTDIVDWADRLKQQQPVLAAFADEVRQAGLALDFARLQWLSAGGDFNAVCAGESLS